MKTCKKLLAITIALVLLVSTLVSGLVVSAKEAGTLVLTSQPITESDADTKATVDLTFEYGEPGVVAPHKFITISTDPTFVLEDVVVASVNGKAASEYGTETDGDGENAIILNPCPVYIEKDGINTSKGLVLLESKLDENTLITDVVITATYTIPANTVAGKYPVTATADYTDYYECDDTLGITNGEIVIKAAHEHAAKDLVNNEDGTHTVKCECGETIETVKCVYENGECACGAEEPAPECDHADANRELTSATTTELVFTYTCPSCNEVYTETHPVTDITSSTFKFTHTLNVESDITLNFKFKKSNLTNYTDVFAVFDKARFNETELTNYDRVIMLPEQDPNAASNYIFAYTGVAAKEMNSDIVATLYAKNANGEYVCATEVYGVVYYVKQILAQPTSVTYSKNLKTALVDMVNYGSKAQLHFKYNKNSLGSDEITDYQEEYASVPRETFTDSRTTSEFSGSVVTSWAQTLDLENKVVVNIRMVAPSTLDISKYVLKVTYTTTGGENKTLEILGSSGEIEYKNSRWVYAFDALTAIQFTETFTAALYDLEDNQVSTVWTSGIESYAAAVIAQPTNATYTENLKTMLTFMMTYGDSVNYYFKNR